MGDLEGDFDGLDVGMAVVGLELGEDWCEERYKICKYLIT